MAYFFVPYAGDQPAAVLINGHRLIILAREQTMFEEHDLAEFCGADKIKRISGGSTKDEEVRVLDGIARSIKAGVVIAPREAVLGDVIRDLEMQLPWIQ